MIGAFATAAALIIVAAGIYWSVKFRLPLPADERHEHVDGDVR